MIAVDPRLQLHLAVTEATMDMADRLRQFNSNDENLKVAVILGMRTFNAFAASIKLRSQELIDRNGLTRMLDREHQSVPLLLFRFRVGNRYRCQPRRARRSALTHCPHSTTASPGFDVRIGLPFITWPAHYSI